MVTNMKASAKRLVVDGVLSLTMVAPAERSKGKAPFRIRLVEIFPPGPAATALSPAA
jgi:hypothetical protein